MKMLLASPARDRRGVVPLVRRVELLAEVVDAVEGDDDPEVAHALLDLAAQAAERLQAGGVLPLHPAAGGARQHQHTGRRHQRREAEPQVERHQEDRRAGHQEQVRRELHQRLREELVQLVGVVVDPRDQIAGLVLVEEVERQLLQLGEEARCAG